MSRQLASNEAGVLRELESLRGIAAIVVVLFHFPSSSWISQNVIVRNGYLMVDFFFVLSGFIMTIAYQNRISEVGDLKAFVRKRFFRLYPLHIATFAVMVMIESAKYIAGRCYGLLSDPVPFSYNSALAGLSHLFLLQVYVADGLTFNGVSWSISVEMQLYALFGVLLLALKEPKSRILASTAIVLSASLMLFLQSPVTLEMTNGSGAMLRGLFGFFLGALGAFADRHTGHSEMSPSKLHMGGGIAIIVTALPFVPAATRKILVPLLALLVVCLMARKGSGHFRRILQLPALVWLGTISYSVYLTHLIVWWTVRRLLLQGLRVHETVDTFGRTIPDVDPLLATILSIGGLLATIAISGWTYRNVEARYRVK